MPGYLPNNSLEIFLPPFLQSEGHVTWSYLSLSLSLNQCSDSNISLSHADTMKQGGISADSGSHLLKSNQLQHSYRTEIRVRLSVSLSNNWPITDFSNSKFCCTKHFRFCANRITKTSEFPKNYADKLFIQRWCWPIFIWSTEYSQYFRLLSQVLKQQANSRISSWLASIQKIIELWTLLWANRDTWFHMTIPTKHNHRW